MGVRNIAIPFVSVSGEFTFVINTGSNPVTISGQEIPGSTFKIDIAATVKILGFEMQGDLSIGVQDGIFSIEIEKLALNFFNVIDVDVSGYIRSNGQFKFRGEVNLEWARSRSTEAWVSS
jgi:pyrrolidone-carboxylate peptidase